MVVLLDFFLTCAFIESRTLHRWFEKCKCRIDQVFLCIFPISFQFFPFTFIHMWRDLLKFFFYKCFFLILVDHLKGWKDDTHTHNFTWEWNPSSYASKTIFSFPIKKCYCLSYFAFERNDSQRVKNQGGIRFHLICVRR